MRAVAALVALAIATSCSLATASPASARDFDLEGHRGTRGLAPENTLAAYRKALKIGVTTLELDLAVTRDGVLVVSHNPELNPDITRGPDGKWLTLPGPAIHDLTLAELKRYDIGRINPASRYAASFPRQVASDGERFPTLQEVVDLVQASGRDVRLNIEIKTNPMRPAQTVTPEEFAGKVADFLQAQKLVDRVTVESFDFRALVDLHRRNPAIRTVCLTLQRGGGDNVQAGRPGVSPWTAGIDIDDLDGRVPLLVQKAGCAVWSPYWRDMATAQVEDAHRLGLTVIPWTIDEPSEMARVIDMGVDGLITDYPDVARGVMKDKGLTLPP